VAANKCRGRIVSEVNYPSFQTKIMRTAMNLLGAWFLKKLSLSKLRKKLILYKMEHPNLRRFVKLIMELLHLIEGKRKTS